MLDNCPNCGAPHEGPFCNYCGTMLEDPDRVLRMAVGQRASLSFEADGRVYEFDMVVESADISSESNPTSFYADGRLVYTTYSPEHRASFSGRLVPSDRHGAESLVVVKEEA